jgi:hypothetical protein
MATTTQYNPQRDIDARLREAGASKTVYALITPETEEMKAEAMGFNSPEGRAAFFDQFRRAWTGQQDALHEDFFDTWEQWADRAVKFNRDAYPYHYPTAGASEGLRHLIYDFAARGGRTVHVFRGEYEGYKSLAEAAGLTVEEHDRDNWRYDLIENDRLQAEFTGSDERMFFISQPSAIDGMVWQDFNEFVADMAQSSVVADVTYVGAVPECALTTRIDLDAISIRNIVFSLSKPFGLYYDRVGGIFCRDEDGGLFGNKWFKSLTALMIGTEMMRRFGVFDFPNALAPVQERMIEKVNRTLGLTLRAADVFLLGTSDEGGDDPLRTYLRRAGKLRVCLTPGMAQEIGTAGFVGDE